MKFYIIDCFAEKKYQGNQLLVVIPDRELSSHEQAQIAREINFSETTFLFPDKKDNGGYDVRIWTPNTGEVPFAGHPTLGTAFVIHHFLEAGQEKLVKLNLKVGQIPVAVEDKRLTMTQNSPTFGDFVAKEDIATVFGIPATAIREDYPVQWVSTGLEAVLIPLKDKEALATLTMNKEAFEHYLVKYPQNYCNHLFFVETGEGNFSARCLMEDFHEDPATGSANGDLAAYLLEHDYFGQSHITYTVTQGEDMGRPSILSIEASKHSTNWSIKVGGQCQLIASGDWN